MKENMEIPTNGLEPRGEITIEVFDEKTGELVSKTKKTNFVQQRLIEAIMNTTARWPLTGASLYSYLPDEYFNSVILTDNGAAPDPASENFILGNISGYASRDYAASGTNRGAWNESESIVRTDYVKLVYDFATSQANGTFQSIYTARKYQGTLNNNTPNVLANANLKLIPKFNYVARDAGALYILTDTYDKIFKITEFKFAADKSGYFDTVAEEIPVPLETGSSSRYLPMFAIRGNEIYTQYLNYTDSKTIRKFTIGQTTPATTVKTFTYTPAGMLYDYKRDQFLISEGTRLRVYDNAFNEIEVIDFGFSLGRITGISDDGKIYIFSSMIVERETKRVEYIVSSTSTNNSTYNIVPLGNYMIGQRSNTYLQVMPGPMFFSRALLDQPVTKTAQQNMKITYEFNIPPLNLLSSAPVV